MNLPFPQNLFSDKCPCPKYACHIYRDDKQSTINLEALNVSVANDICMHIYKVWYLFLNDNALHLYALGIVSTCIAESIFDMFIFLATFLQCQSNLCSCIF